MPNALALGSSSGASATVEAVAVLFVLCLAIPLKRLFSVLSSEHFLLVQIRTCIFCYYPAARSADRLNPLSDWFSARERALLSPSCIWESGVIYGKSGSHAFLFGNAKEKRRSIKFSLTIGASVRGFNGCGRGVKPKPKNTIHFFRENEL